jgi:hypothetical protein
VRAIDNGGPVFENNTARESWKLIDTVIMWSNNLQDIVNNNSSWNNPASKWFIGFPKVKDACGNGTFRTVVDDQVSYYDCNAGNQDGINEPKDVHAKLVRSFHFFDNLGNKNTITQVIYFKRPSLNDICNASNSSFSNRVYDFGPNNMTSFGVLGNNKRIRSSSYFPAGNIDMLTNDYACGGQDMVKFNSCRLERESQLDSVLTGIYMARYFLPSGKMDSVSLYPQFEGIGLNSKKISYEACEGGKKVQVITQFMGRCGEMIQDTVLIVFANLTGPQFVAANGTGSILGRDAKNPVIVSTNTAGCDEGSLRLPRLNGSSERDLGSLFNWAVTDHCSGRSAVSLTYGLESKLTRSGGKLWTRTNNYTPNIHVSIPRINGEPVMMGIPVGEHRLIIGANTASCGTQNKDTLYFVIEDKVPPVMICDDNINVSLVYEASSNWYVDGRKGSGYAKVYAEDVDEGSYDNCTMSKMYVRRVVDKSCLEKYYFGNMEYDRYGNNDGSVDFKDFELITTGPQAGNYYTPKFMNYVEFYCCDLGKNPMVELWGGDIGGINGSNWNHCWTTITVEDKVNPTVKRPDLTASYNSKAKNWIDCRDEEALKALEDEKKSGELFGWPLITGLDCSGEVNYFIMKSLSCGAGRITRHWEVTKTVKGMKVVARDSQVINVRGYNKYSLIVPADQVVDCGNLSAEAIRYDEDGCDLLAVNVSDSRFDAGTGCHQIYRTYTVINWCQVPTEFNCTSGNTDPGYYARVIPRNMDASGLGRKWVHQFEKSTTATTMRSGAFGSSLVAVPLSAYIPQHPAACASDQTFAWKYVQVLSVVDKTAPIIEANVNGGVHTSTTNDCKGDVSFKFKAWDACASNVLTFDRATLYASNSPLSLPINNLVRGAYQTKDSTFQVKLSKVEVGNYILKVEIRDDCGNYASRQIPFTVTAAEAPAPVCVQTLTVSLTTNDNSQPYHRIRAIDFLQDTDRDFNKGSCSPGGFVSIIREFDVKQGFVPRKADSILILNCNDLGGIPARVYFTSGSGKVSYCSVSIDVNDNNKLCESLASIAGEVKTESKAPVEGAEMNLSGEMKMMKPTALNGKYELSNLTAKKDYTVTPSLDKDYLNGVSTFDLVTMQRHILDSRKLDSPYKLIAADINNSKTITVLDMIQLRKLILGIITKFENNSSWRFIPTDYVFPNPANPWQESFPEVKNFNNLVGKANNASFVGIKMGDLNGSVIPNTAGGQIRSFVDKVTLNLSEMKLEAGETKKVAFSLENMKDIEGIQFTMEFDKSSLELIDVVNEIAQDEHVAIFGDENLMTVSWNGSVREGALFHLVLRAKKPAYLSEAIRLNDRITKKEAYINGKLHDVVPGFNVNQDGQVYALYQNVPNPFTDETIIGFQLPVSERGTLEIQDASGRVVKVFESEFRKGYNQQKVKLADLKGPGVYFYKLNTANYSESKSFILIK